MLKIFAPNFIYRLCKIITLPAIIFFILFICIGLYSAYNSPIDYQQKETVKIMYIHVPSAWMALGIYLLIGILSIISIIARIPTAFLLASSAAPIGMIFALITLVTGSIWGYPIWGTWWVWDARLTSMFVLFMLYIAYLGILHASSDNIFRAEKPAAVIAILGFINVPIVKFSVNLWNSLHQPASILRSTGPSIDPSMLKPLLIMFLAFIFLFIALCSMRFHVISRKIHNLIRNRI
jgi:heme exporter protein C